MTNFLTYSNRIVAERKFSGLEIDVYFLLNSQLAVCVTNLCNRCADLGNRKKFASPSK